MGAKFGSILVKTGDTSRVRAALETVARRTDTKFLMGPEMKGWISVFPDQDQSDEASVHLARMLPDDMFQFMVFDDDIFMYWFYRKSELVDRYNSCPDYFEGMGDTVITEEEKQKCVGRPELFQDLLSGPEKLAKLKQLLAASHDDYMFENERMEKFVELLGLVNASSSYDYLQGGERDWIEEWERFVHIEFVPQTAEDYNQRGEARREKHDLDGAKADFDKALELEPGLTTAKDNLVTLERAKGDRNEKLVRMMVNRGDFERDEGDLNIALSCYDQAIELCPTFAEAWNGRGLAKRKKGDLDGALADFTQAIELDPALPSAYNNRALVKTAKGDLAGAMADYDRAIELKPEIEAHIFYENRASLKRKQGDLDGAMADYDSAIRVKPDRAKSHYRRAQIKRAKADLDGALADVNRAIEINPKMAGAYNERGLVKQAKGDAAGALADFDQAIVLKPGVGEFHLNRGTSKYVLQDLDGAIADCNQAIELKPDFAESYIVRARAKKAQGDLDGALADLAKSLELKPDFAPSLASRGDAKRLKGDLEGALADFNRVLELMPNWAQVREQRDAVVKKLKDGRAKG